MATISCDGKLCSGSRGKSLFECADVLAVPLPSTCERKGTCHECIIEIVEGVDALNPPTLAESFLRDPCRLACQAKIENPNIDVRFLPWRRHSKILTARQEKFLQLDPQVTLRGNEVYYGQEPIGRYRGHLYGIAMDLGTTTVVCDLVDLESGSSLYLSSFDNPQRFGGSDIMHRISYDGGSFHGELHKAIIHALNHEIREICKKTGVDREEIYEIVVAGNSTMRDLFFDMDVQSIGQKPYKSMTELEMLAGKRQNTVLIEKAASLGIQVHSKAKICGMPLIASHVGADTVADLLAIDMDSQRDVVMMVDVGTNTEVVIGHAGRMMVASCPAGPAFEGGAVKFGMPGCDGAIENFSWKAGKFDYRTIGGIAPQGICGSGLIDLLAELRRHGLMTPKGVFADKKYVLDIVPEYGITFSREDASYLAQAKAANYCGQYILMREFGVDPVDIRKLYLAGGFANYVDIANAIEIGFLAPVPQERIEKIGNASVQGAKEFLISKKRRDSIQKLFEKMTHVELETTPDFFELFVEGCQFKPMPKEIVSLAVPRKGGIAMQPGEWPKMPLRELVEETDTFVTVAELVTSRGLITGRSGRKVLHLARELSTHPQVHALSITDNPGGNAMIGADAFGTDLISRGQEVIIHLSCKDWNRNALQSRGWQLASEGFNNILALSGDFPTDGYQGQAGAVFDIDSVALLRMYADMNKGLELTLPNGQTRKMEQTHFFLGAVVNNHKRYEREVMPQYFKLAKKIECGASFIITQIGYDSRKHDELLKYMALHNLRVPVLANVFVLSLPVARFFHADKIPGCVVTDELLALIEKQAQSQDKGKAFLLEFAAKQCAVAKGLGFRGLYLGGHWNYEDFTKLLEIIKGFGENDWKEFAREIQFHQPDEFFYFEPDPDTGLSSTEINRAYLQSKSPEALASLRQQVPLSYKLNRLTHDKVFVEDTLGFRAGKAISEAVEKSDGVLRKTLHALEYGVKIAAFDCRDCGDCSLPDIAYLCPESQCAKNQRNGPCGGTRRGKCEVGEKDCIWALSYDRLKAYGEEENMLKRPVVIKNAALQGTSGWMNKFLGRDHSRKRS